MAIRTWKVVALCGLPLIGCGGKSADGAEDGSGGFAASGAQGGNSGHGGTTSAGQGGSMGGTTANGGGPAVGGSSVGGGSTVGGSGFGGGGGIGPQCFPGEENACDCGGFSSCQPDGTWSPCDCPSGQCNDDETQSLDLYKECARSTCVAKLSTPEFEPCVVACAQDSLGVSAGCASCMGALVECAATVCISDCLNDIDGSCEACLCARGCAQRAQYCAGANAELPVCEVP